MLGICILVMHAELTHIRGAVLHWLPGHLSPIGPYTLYIVEVHHLSDLSNIFSLLLGTLDNFDFWGDLDLAEGCQNRQVFPRSPLAGAGLARASGNERQARKIKITQKFIVNYTMCKNTQARLYIEFTLKGSYPHANHPSHVFEASLLTVVAFAPVIADPMGSFGVPYRHKELTNLPH